MQNQFAMHDWQRERTFGASLGKAKIRDLDVNVVIFSSQKNTATRPAPNE
jgi:hypothetical protein